MCPLSALSGNGDGCTAEVCVPSCNPSDGSDVLERLIIVCMCMCMHMCMHMHMHM